MALEVDFRKKIGGFMLDVKFTGENRSHIGILGASGCGKSMTLKCIAGIVKPDEGRIVLNGKVLFDSEKKINLSPQRRNVGYLFQNYALFPRMTVGENIAIGIRYRMDKSRKQEIVRSLIKKFHLEDLDDRYPSQLSGGQQQRVALARMLANEPDIIMLDEPFSALDSFLKEKLQREMHDIMKEYQGEVLMVSHNRDEIFKLTDKLAIMDEGKIVTYSETKTVFDNPGYVEAARLTGCKNISKVIKTGDYRIRAIDWNITLNTIQKVTEDINYVGIRAHHIVIDKGNSGVNDKGNSGVNEMKVNLIERVELPFDANYIVRDSNDIGSEIWIKIAKTNIGADYEYEDIQRVVFLPERLLLLR